MAYIDADKFLNAMIEKFKCVPLLGVPKYSNGEEWFDGESIKELIEEQPTADVVEVKHGEWIPIVKQDDYLDPPYCDTIKCSECGEAADVSFHDAKYCWRCGAKMDGERKDT